VPATSGHWRIGSGSADRRQSQQFSRFTERAGRLPIPVKSNLAKSGERLHANAVQMEADPSASCRSDKLAVGSNCMNSSRCNQPLEEGNAIFMRSEFDSMGGYHEFSDTPRTSIRV
jgi:hypothetical protein